MSVQSRAHCKNSHSVLRLCGNVFAPFYDNKTVIGSGTDWLESSALLKTCVILN